MKDRQSPSDERGRGENYVAPRNETEKKLVGIWSHLLRKDEGIGIDNNFFQSGGNSLKASRMTISIHKEMSVNMQLSDVHRKPTIRELAEYITVAEEDKYSPIETPVNGEYLPYYPLSSPQKRLYFIDQLEKDNTANNTQLMDIYCKAMEKEKLEETFKKLIKRHESLRTSFLTREGEAVQEVHDFEEVGSNFAIEFWETHEDGMIYSMVPGKEWSLFTGLPFRDVIEHFVRPFDLSKAPLLRVGLIKIWGETQILMLDMHHIIADGVSKVLLIKDLWELYDEEELPPLRLQYKDYIKWTNSEEQKEAVKTRETYWLHEFAGEIPLLNLPTDYPRPEKPTFAGDSLYFEIGEEETQKLNMMAEEKGATLYVVLLAVYNVLMTKLCGQEDITVGTITAGRNHADLQETIGMFANTLAMRNFPEAEMTFETFLLMVKLRTITAFDNQDYPLEELVRKATRKDISRNPLFDVVFAFENEVEHTDKYLLHVLMLDNSKPNGFKNIKSRFDMTLTGAENRNSLQFTLEYKTSLFKEETIERFVSYFKKIVFSVCLDVRQEISEIDIIPDSEKAVLLYIFNDTESEYPKKRTINELFEEAVVKYPDNKAVTGMAHGAWGTQLTYKEVNAKANQLSEILRAKGIKPDSIAAVMLDPCQEMIVGLMGILKAGGAFLPIKDGIPKDRTEYILQESGTQFLLTRRDLLEGITFKGEIIQLGNPKVYSGDISNPQHVNKPQDLAYVIYTSGSTGKPKGVMVSHHSLANLCFWHNKYYSVTAKDHATQYAGFGFDTSVWEVFPYLVVGAAFCIVPEEIKSDTEKLNRYFEDNAITISFLPTQICEQFMTTNNTSLRVLLTGGDKLKSFEKKHYQLYNHYGPMENTVAATSYPVTGLTANIPIGKPIFNNQLYILDKNKHLQPLGVPGELYIGGDSTARGYLNNPKLTDEQFIMNPYPIPIPLLQSPRLYRTGDMARWHADGNIELFGRIGCQEKTGDSGIEPVDYSVPRNKIEKILAEVWCKALGLEEISIDDIFFDIGGDSIKTIRISAMLSKRNLRVNVPDFFSYPTIRELAVHVKKNIAGKR